MKREIRIAGFGGQGVILACFILGKAACVHDRYNAVQSQSYGPEARGGAARAEVIISDEKIAYPRPTGVDLFVAMAQEAFDTYRHDVREDTIIIVEPDLVPRHDLGRPVYRIPAQRMAQELGNKVVTNITMLGAIAGIYDLPATEALRKAVAESVPARFLDLNIRAFDKGLEAGRNARAE